MSPFSMDGQINSAPAPLPIAMPGANWLRSFRRRMLGWFDRHARDLPWRRTQDPYAIWVSEIMLQQTQVTTVIEYYPRFLSAFPTVSDLAGAEESEVLRLWEGLGYYRRARQLHLAAKRIVTEHAGQFPRDFEAIRSLPGIGRYTAGAIASIAFDDRRPILEANTTRLFCRLLAFREDPARGPAQKLLWAFSESLLPARRNSGRLNQSLMELGSTICTPRSPRCDRCPVAMMCPAKQHGLQGDIPARTKKTVYEDRRETAVVIRHRGKVLLRQCCAGERWAGLWDFPRFEVRGKRDEEIDRELERAVLEISGLHVNIGRPILTMRHSVTRFRITLTCREASREGGRLRGTNIRWVSPRNLVRYPLSVTGRRISQIVAGDGAEPAAAD